MRDSNLALRRHLPIHKAERRLELASDLGRGLGDDQPDLACELRVGNEPPSQLAIDNTPMPFAERKHVRNVERRQQRGEPDPNASRTDTDAAAASRATMSEDQRVGIGVLPHVRRGAERRCAYLQVSAITFTDSTCTDGGRSTFGFAVASSSAGGALGCCTVPVTSTFLLT